MDLTRNQDTQRIFLDRYDSTGQFPDGRIKLDVYFKDEKGGRYVWTPPWEGGSIRLFREAYRIESLNTPRGKYSRKFREAAKELLTNEDSEITDFEILGGNLEGMKEGKLVISFLPLSTEEITELLDLGESPADIEQHRQVRDVALSREFSARVVKETGDLVSWLRQHVGASGNWIILNGEIDKVEWCR